MTDGVRQGQGRTRFSQGALGCAAAVLLVSGALAFAGYAVYRKGTTVVALAWKELRTTTERLRTPESARALYRANPDLSAIYPTEGEFLKWAETCRSKLEAVPERPPPLSRLLKDRQLLQVHENRSDGHMTLRIRYVFRNGAVLVMETDQGRLTDLLLK